MKAAKRKSAWKAAALGAVMLAGALGGTALMVRADAQTWSGSADTSWFDPTYTTFKIDTPAKLAGIAKLVNEDEGVDGLKGKILEVDQSLDLSALDWVPIGTESHPFRGTLIAKDGAMLGISGMRVPAGIPYQGLVGNMEGGTVGGFRFAADGSIGLSTVTGNVYAGAAVGRMAGYSIVYDIENEIGIGAKSLAGTAYAGGIVGSAEGQVANVSNGASVTTEGSAYAGGLIGYVSSGSLQMKTAHNGGAVTSGGDGIIYAGGLTGYTAGILIMNDQNTVIANTAPVQVTAGSIVHAGGFSGGFGAPVLFSGQTAASGSVTVEAPKAAEVYAGGLAGSIDGSLPEVTMALPATGAVGVHAGGTVHAGGIAGHVGPMLSWSKGYAQSAPVEAQGGGDVYAGGLFGSADGGLQLQEASSRAFSSSGDIHVLGGGKVRAGGIVGELGGGMLGQAGFKGSLDARAQAAQGDVQAGGIAGRAAAGTVIHDVHSGGTAEAPVSITAQGELGGIAGRAEGTIRQSSAAYLVLKAVASDSSAGGIAGSAAGVIENVSAGDPDAKDSSSIRLEAHIAAPTGGRDSFTAGGLLGRGFGELTVAGSRADRLSAVLPAGKAGYAFGGAAGRIEGHAVLGTAADPVRVAGIALNAQADDAALGGAVGRLEGSVQAALLVRGLEIESGGASARIGGLAGESFGSLTGGEAEDITIRSAGADARLGGAAGLSGGSISGVAASRVAIEAGGAGAEAGGIAGRLQGAADSRASLTDSSLAAGEETTVTATAAAARIGGAAGYAVRADIVRPAVSAEAPNYAALAASAPGVEAGGLVGRAEDSLIEGDGKGINVQNLLLTASSSASETKAGGIAGRSSESTLRGLVGSGASLLLSGPNAQAGGLLGTHKGGEQPSVSGNLFTGMQLKANASAAGSTVGGLAGRLEARAGDPAAHPQSSLGIIANSRVSGSVQALAPGMTVGGLVGENGSLIANVSVTDKLPVSSKGADAVVGGLVGRNAGTGTLYYVYTNANLTIEGQGTLAGGLVGDNAGRILSSYTDLDLTSKAYGTAGQPVFLGGLAGRSSGGIEQAYAASKVAASGAYAQAGGLIGELSGGTVKNAYSAKSVTASGTGAYAGGFAGRIASGKVSYSYSAAEVTASGTARAGGFAGRYDNTSKELLYKSYYIKDEKLNLNKDLPDFADGQYRWLSVLGRLSTILSSTLADRSEFPALSGWDFATAWKYGSLSAQYQYPEVNRAASSGGGDDGTGGSVNTNVNWYLRDKDAPSFQIGTEAELAGLAAIVNGTLVGIEPFGFEGRSIEIKGPIHIQSAQWSPIGVSETLPFQGELLGGGHLIDGYAVSGTVEHGGLFGVIGAKGSVSGLKLEPKSVHGSAYAGALAGRSFGRIDGVELKLPEQAAVIGGVAGGIVGRNEGAAEGLRVELAGGRVESAAVRGAAGGIVGENVAAIASGSWTLTTSGEAAGRIAASGGEAAAGGLIGRQSGASEGLKLELARLVVEASGTGSAAGGLVGHYQDGSAAKLEVFFGEAGAVRAAGDEAAAGGLIGISEAGNELSGLKAEAISSAPGVTGGGSAGGLIGEKTGRGIAAWDIRQATVKGLTVASPAGAQEASVGGLVGRAERAALHGAEIEASLNAKGGSLSAGGAVGTGRDVTIQDAKMSGPIAASLDAGSSGTLAAGGIAGELSASDRDAELRFGGLYPLYRGLYQTHYSGKLALAAGGGDSQLLAGGLVGRLLQASVYESDSRAAIAAGTAGTLSAGGIAGYSSGVLVHADAHGGIDASGAGLYRVGGLVGQGEDGEIHYSRVLPEGGAVIAVGTAVTIGENLPAAYAGGAVGQGDRMEVTRSSASIPVEVTDANIDTTLYAGGFAGLLGDGGTGAGSIRYSYADGAVKASGKRGSYAGGFAGSIERFAVEDSYASGSVSNAGQDTRTGGFAAAVERTGAVKRSYALQGIVSTTGLAGTTRSYTGGFAGYNDGTIDGVYASVGELASNAKGTDSYKGELVGYNFRDGRIAASAYTGSGAAVGRNAGAAASAEAVPARNPLASGAWRNAVDPSILRLSGSGEIVIGSREQLDGYVLLRNDTGLAYFRLFDRKAAASPLGSGGKIRLAADIDLSAFGWTPLQDFDGELDGGGYRLSGLRAEAGASGDAAFTLVNRGRIRNLQLLGAEVNASRHAGLVAAVNSAGGELVGVTAEGSVSGGASAGLIAGVNEGAIAQSGAAGKAHSAASAGGLAGDNREGGTIERSYSAADVSAHGAEAAAGGAAGVNAGLIADTLATGRTTADGLQHAWAGGIAGRLTGLVERSVAGGEAVASADGAIQPGRSFFGGLAGKLEAGGEIRGSSFHKQMVKRGVAYYDAAGSISSEGALGGAELTSGSLPAGLSGSVWRAAAGFYPAPADGALARLAAAAAVPAAGDSVNRLTSSFGLSQAEGLRWSADASLALLQAGSGKLLAGGAVAVKAELGGFARSIVLNSPELRWPQAAAAPRVVSGEKEFKEKVEVALAAEPGAVIRYTLDGSEPGEMSAAYEAPITLKATTTLKAIAVEAGKEYSPVLSGEWKLKEDGGGFVFFPGPMPSPSPTPEPKPALESNIGKPSIGEEKPASVRVPRGSILRLTAPEGKWIRYTTDGSDPTENSPRFIGELVLTRSMTVKAIVEGDKRILTYVFEVGSASYDLRKDASTIRYAAGYADGTFKPNAAMSRYELIESLAPLLDREPGELRNAFPDKSDRSEQLVAFFASAGIVGGYPDGTFGGDRSLTRAEFAVIASRVLRLDVNEAAAPKQKDAIKHWAAPYIGALTQAGLIQGFPDGSFRPNSPLTRAQAVVLINRMAGTAKRTDAGPRFTDLTSAHWAYKDIMSAAGPTAPAGR
ncbi:MULTISPECIES: chitobiase/beta-hexosaminidase C-terminal domain-containing protein [unclassified Paenibacillus]|uniref:chitobiase/beta-hexosaminidase C-terminal domain-containing protein n=1 Tax=unclassified Paenibacillus TaxID=185978 RepID=UPI000955D2EF|nr:MULTISPECIES: chitobiase/beta-hexosaminidase C-terminal domain-containing protein [unclassified Paenibacillus]ASS68273.1 hypothetical protein CIC07_20675 [Paenibacillus sp. RUD330]SIR26969.1 S-layer homology domain-containing protein [Paenibacillus sp. RU4X]SIR39705.1 S-layer homology domain-containing protein [Paenibacillus sp. RU4T]